MAQRQNQRRQNPNQNQRQNDEILRYAPLVKNIATYFYQMNQNVELEDCIQEGWHGLLMAYKKYDASRGVSLGAFAHRYIFGRIYRSLLGTKNLQNNKRMILLESSDKILDNNQIKEDFLLDLYDYILSNYQPHQREILIMVLQNYKKTEIIQQLKISTDLYDQVLMHFKNNYDFCHIK